MILLVNRTQQWKQLAFLAETDPDRLQSLSLLILALEHLKPLPSLASLPTIPLTNILSLSLSINHQNNLLSHTKKPPYQQILELTQLQNSNPRTLALESSWLGVRNEQIAS